MRQPPHPHAMQAKAQLGSELGQDLVGPLPARGGIAEDADVVAPGDLPARDIEHVPEQAAERGPEDVQNAQRRLGAAGSVLRAQNQRSLMTIVSPGRIG